MKTQKDLSLKDNILKFLRRSYPHKVAGAEIERKALVHGYKASNASRRCRDLVAEGVAEVSYAGTGVKHAWYVAKVTPEWQPITNIEPAHVKS